MSETPTTSSGLSVVLITLNEASRIRRCLESVSWADEIIVVDSGSTDQTCELARAFTRHVFTRTFDDYSSQKNFGIEQAKGGWVLSLDADEVVASPLRLEMEAVLQRKSPEDCFHIPRRNIYFGHPVPHVMGYDEPVRLFMRECRFSGTVHEKIAGKHPGHLNAPLFHFSCETFGEWVEKHRAYTRMDAARHYRRGRRFQWRHMLLSPWRVLWLRLFRLQGWKDGWPGAAISIEMAKSTVLFEQELLRLTRTGAK
ncbi:MAG: glycosyltransferase family 2 protein [Lentisphaerota bacterium]